ncbi:MAG: class IV adenylate cyclase [Candidatus Vogelbacteria bacterium]|nr:class IV adenylate cyclase [Candidatus Vogelbacteria bacterium]
MSHINIEIKAKCADQGKVREILKLHKADFKGTDHQVDTYFKANNGRLKIREGNIENYLIFYEREDKEGPKQSDVILYKHEPGSNLKELLIKSLGVLAVVDKQREIYFIDNVKFHLDDVKSLGTFMEIEAIDTTGNIAKEKLLEQCNRYLELLGIDQADLITNSYSDQILKS